MRRERTVSEMVETARAMRWWVDRQIERGRTDDEIVAEFPVALAFITGRIDLDDINRALPYEERRSKRNP